MSLYRRLCLAVLSCSAALVSAQVQDAESNLRLFTNADVFQLEYASEPQLSPDGSTVAYVRRSADIMVDKFRGSVWLVDTDSGEHQPLLADQGNYSNPRWSPQSDRLAFTTSEGETHQITVQWLASGRRALIANLTERPSALSWSPAATSTLAPNTG